MKDANFEDLLRIALELFMKTTFTPLIEIYMSLNHVSSPIMQEFFGLKVTPYSLRNINLLRLPKTNTTRYGTQALREVQCGTQFQIDIKI